MAGGAGVTRERKVLTTKAIEALKASASPYRVPDARCPGLALRVATSGLKTWDLAYRVSGTGKVFRRSLGSFNDLSLEEARERARDVLRAARRGDDLFAAEQAQRSANAARITVEALIDEYARRSLRGRLRTAAEMERRLRRGLAPILTKAAGDVRRRDIRDLLDPVADGGLLREAERRRQVIGAMFRWGVAQDHVENDPTAGLTAYDAGTPRERVLTPDEMRVLWQWLADADMPPAMADLLRFQLATGARAGEVGGITAAEIDTEAWTWTLPAARSKNKRMRVTPLVGIARSIIESRLTNGADAPLFANERGKPLRAEHIGQALGHRRERLPIAWFSTHDMRRTVATSLFELGISLEMIATVLGQEAGGRTTRTLVRHYVKTDVVERKASILTAWDRHLASVVAGGGKQPTNIAMLTPRQRG